jgi:type II secretory pathway pseudopilin PulG
VQPRGRGLGAAGAALLEAIIALTLVAVAGTAAVTMVSQALAAVQAAREADRELRRASAFFDAVSLWTREDLDLRLGSRPQGPWRLRVDRPERTLYVVSLTDSAETREILRTSLFRPDPADAPLP